GLSLDLSYNYNDNETLRTHLPLIEQVPSQTAKLFTSWRPAFLQKALFSLGASYRDVVSQKGTQTIYDPITQARLASFPFTFKEAPYVVFDLGVDYDLTSSVALKLWIENVTDVDYLSTVSTGVNFVGQPRTVTATLRWR